MNILQVSLADSEGGAEKIAWTLHQSYLARGHDSWLAVARKKTNAPHIVRIPQETYRSVWERCWGTLSHVWYPHRNRHRMFARLYWVCFELGSGHLRDGLHGLENFNFPATHHILELPPRTPEILHCHNLHGNYFDLRELPFLSHRTPMVLTLHDAWMFSGHCAHSFGCERWKIGCGDCPDLKTYPGLVCDATAENWQRKRNIYAQSDLFVATPCQWLFAKAQQSVLAPAIRLARVIPYGIDLNVFHPGDKRAVREKLGLPSDAVILLFAANGIRHNVFKDFYALRNAIIRVAQVAQQRSIVFIALGEAAPNEQFGAAQIVSVPFRQQAAEVAQYYQAADIYLHAAKADTFPNTVLEALACGVPVIATAVGGIPEQIRHRETGILTPPGDANALCDAILSMLSDPARLSEMGKLAVDDARQRFDMERMTDNYWAWYQEISEIRRKRRAMNPAAPPN